MKDPHGNDVTDQFKITTEDGKLTIDKRSVTITAGSAEKEYDGSALTADQPTRSSLPRASLTARTSPTLP